MPSATALISCRDALPDRKPIPIRSRLSGNSGHGTGMLATCGAASAKNNQLCHQRDGPTLLSHNVTERFCITTITITITIIIISMAGLTSATDCFHGAALTGKLSTR